MLQDTIGAISRFALAHMCTDFFFKYLLDFFFFFFFTVDKVELLTGKNSVIINHTEAF